MTIDVLIRDGFELEDWSVEPRLGRLVRDQVVVSLRPRVMDALVVLAANAGAVVSKRTLVDRVWSSGFVADNTVVHCINELREALGEDASAPRLLQTIPRRGYRLSAEVRPIEEIARIHAIDGARFQLVGRHWAGLLLDGDNLIGRGGDARIIAPSPKVSRHHALIEVSEQGVVIEDLASKNGTFVAERRIDEPTSITDGIEVRFADVTLQFCRRAPSGLDETMSMDSS